MESRVGMTTVVAQTSRNGRKPSPTQQADGRIAQSRHDFRPIICMDGAAIFSQGHIFDVMQAIFNGIITNDKFCMSRIKALQISPARKLETQEIQYPSKTGTGECLSEEETNEKTALEYSAFDHRDN